MEFEQKKEVMEMGTEGLTPMMKQFFSLKVKYPDAILFFRCGDFYETYGKDAIEISKILGLALTHRATKSSDNKGLEMAGFPYHSLDNFLPRLIRSGKRVAICDQLEDPKTTKKLVRRGITEVVTPGTGTNESLLNSKENNFLCAIHFGKARCGIAFLDLSTGEFLTGEGDINYATKLVASFTPKEILYNRTQREDFLQHFKGKIFAYELEDWVFTELSARHYLQQHFGTKNLKGFGLENLSDGITAAGAILYYLNETHHTQLSNITSLLRIEETNYVKVDDFTIRNLEIFHPIHPEGKTLIEIIDHTSSPMGARRLRKWIAFPLKDPKEINLRLDAVEYFVANRQTATTIREEIMRMGDIERIASKMTTGKILPLEMMRFKITLRAIKTIKQLYSDFKGALLQDICSQLDPLEDLERRIESELNDNISHLSDRTGIIKDGVNKTLDELRNIVCHGKDYLIKLQEKESKATDIPNLKIGYNNIFGYYIEVRHTHRDKIPQNWIRKQTLSQAERYTTDELSHYEETILGAENRLVELESKLFNDIIEAARLSIKTILKDANAIATLDCLLSFALTATIDNYNRPIVDNSNVINIKQGRHPVIEKSLPQGEDYVPNDIILDPQECQIMMITGPNMSGKSAILRQTAIITLLAQSGSFVPAEYAKIGVVDKIFTRVGASDNISQGESTFMVEMIEAAYILNNISPRSLVFFDELGRGTSTYDGISIAWAIVEYIHEQPGAKARTLFATHYHELNEMEKKFPHIRNFNVAVKEINNKVIFLRKLTPGGSEHSFGIHVASISGIPKSIIRRANDILRKLEDSETTQESIKKRTKFLNKQHDGIQLSIFQLDDPVLQQVREEVLNLDIDNLTPVESLNKLYEIKKIVTGKSD